MDTVNHIIDTLSVSHHQDISSVNIWLIVAIVELLIIVILLLARGKQNNAKVLAKKRVLAEGQIDMQNIVTSAFNAEPIYKELIIKCHPDRFAPNEEKMAIADELSKQIRKNKHDLKELISLRQEAIEKLNI